QFHDVLPGSSIHEVYQDAHRLLGGVVETATRVRDAALGRVGASSAKAGNRLRVANAGILPRPLRLLLREVNANATVATADGVALPTQATDDGLLVADPRQTVPGLGWTVLTVGAGEATRPRSIAGAVSASGGGGGGGGAVVENDLLRVVVGADGT